MAREVATGAAGNVLLVTLDTHLKRGSVSRRLPLVLLLLLLLLPMALIILILVLLLPLKNYVQKITNPADVDRDNLVVDVIATQRPPPLLIVAIITIVETLAPTKVGAEKIEDMIVIVLCVPLPFKLAQ
tara:strand:- start:3994 stop:4380 length:387 start_codon:yes stop_codon:yes gene_type:complete